MLLTDRDILELYRQARAEGQPPLLAPFVEYKLTGRFPSYGLEPAGYTIRLNPEKGVKLLRRVVGGPVIRVSEPVNQELTWVNNPIYDNEIVIPPMTVALGVSLEAFNLPSTVKGNVEGKSSYARIGLNVFVTPLEPGWRGYLTIEMFNHNPNAIAISMRGGIAQVEFNLLDKVPLASYEGSYQEQKSEVTPARVEGVDAHTIPLVTSSDS